MNPHFSVRIAPDSIKAQAAANPSLNSLTWSNCCFGLMITISPLVTGVAETTVIGTAVSTIAAIKIIEIMRLYIFLPSKVFNNKKRL
jgi:archaellum biogenesis protein FlaJ (TadC family)